MAFATGSDREPPLGFSQQPTIEFIHDKPGLCPSDRLLPTANTCSLILRLPVHSSYDEFAECMEIGIMNSPCFGFV